MDTGLRTLLHDVAQEMPIDVERPRRRTLRRARTRRAVSAAGVGLVAVAIVAVSVSALRLLSEPRVPANTGPQPGPAEFAGLWPETDAEALAETQAAVDDGHHPLRTTPPGTATLLAVDLLGWREDDVRVEAIPGNPVETQLLLRNVTFAEQVPPVVVELRQLGRAGPNGVWSVVGVSSPLIELETRVDGTSDEVFVLGLSGRVSDLYEGAAVLEARAIDGPTPEPIGNATFPLADQRFSFQIGVGPTPDGRATLLLMMPDATGASLGAVMTAIETPVGELPPPGPNVGGIPPDVAVTAQRIHDAASAGDVDALGELLDPNTFVYNFDDGSDPTELWRADPSVLELMVAVLELPPIAREIEGTTFYIWPYLVDVDMRNLTEEQRADLATLGFTPQQVGTPEGFYLGPRLAIDETGLWRNFVTGGD